MTVVELDHIVQRGGTPISREGDDRHVYSLFDETPMRQCVELVAVSRGGNTSKGSDSFEGAIHMQDRQCGCEVNGPMSTVYRTMSSHPLPPRSERTGEVNRLQEES